jgi:hypothetical protein
MNNIIKNLVTTDSVAKTMYDITSKYIEDPFYNVKNAYYNLTPLLIVQANFLLNIYDDIDVKPTIEFLILMNLLETYCNDKINNSSVKYDENKIIETINDIFKNILLEHYSTYRDLNTFTNYFNNNENIDKSINDTFLMNVAIFIGLINENLEETIHLASRFIEKITDNDIKKLSFISLTIFCYYCYKSFIDSNDIYSKEKWISHLIDLFIQNIIDKHIDVNIVNKKKFIFMLIKYKTDIDDGKLHLLPHQRINRLNYHFCTPIAETKDYCPGNTADQLLLLSYDFFVSSESWIGNLTYNCLVYGDARNINLFGSFFYNMTHPKDDMYKMFKKINMDNRSDMNELIVSLNKIFTSPTVSHTNLL